MAIEQTVVINTDTKSLSALKTEIKEIQAQLDLTPSGTKEYDDLIVKLRAAKGELKDFKETTKGLDPDQRAAKLVNSFQGMTGAIQAAAGAMTLFGGNSEDLEKVEKNLLGIIAIGGGIQQTIEGYNDALDVIGPKLKGLGQTIKGAFTTATGAVNGFRVALAGLGIGVVIGLVTVLVDAFNDVSEATAEAKKEQEEYNQKLRDLQIERVELEKGEKAALELKKADAEATLEQNKRLLEAGKVREKIIADAKKLGEDLTDSNDEQRRKDEANLRLNNQQLENDILRYKNKIKSIDEKDKSDAASRQKTANDASVKNLEDATEKEIKATKDKNEALRKLDEERATEGLDAITTQFANNLARLKEQQAEELKQENLTKEAIKDINDKYNALIEVNEIQRIKAVNDFQKEEANKQLALAQKTIDDLKTFREKALDDELKGLDQYYKDRDDLLATALAKGQITQEQYDKKREQNEIAKLENLKQILIDAGKSTIEVERQIAEAKKAIREADSKDAMEKAFANAQFAVEAASQLNNTLLTFAQARTNNQKTEIEKEIQAEIKLAEAKGATQQEIERIKLEGDKKLNDAAKAAFEEQKKFQIAQAILDGGSAILSIFANASANPSTILFPGYPYVQAGIAALFTAAKISQIKSTTFGGGGGGSPSTGGGSTSVPAIPSSSTNTTPLLPQGPTTIGSGQASTTTGQGLGERIVKTYVLSGDVTDAQEAEARINQRRQF